MIDMSGFVNKVIIIGNLGSDPEVIQLGPDRHACRLSVATSTQWRDKATGEPKKDVQWHRVTVFDQNAAKFAKSFLRKGSSVYLEGQLRTRSWEDGTGAKRATTEIVLSDYHCTLLGLSEGRETKNESPIVESLDQLPDDIPWSPSNLGDVPF
jgi:single-strand DNA-binding protein